MSKSIFTIIPAKPFAESKTRLNTILSVSQRVRLSRFLLMRTIKTARAVSDVVVVSRSQKVRVLAKALGAWALVETEPNLNGAILQGLTWVLAKKTTTALVLPADLPTLTTNELQSLISVGLTTTPNIIIAPCHKQEGTNALLLSPPNLILPAFGQGSFLLHQQRATEAGLTPHIYRSPGFALDLDTPADWHALVKDDFYH